MHLRTNISDKGLYCKEEVDEKFPIRLQYRFFMEDAPLISFHYHDLLEIGYCHEGHGVFAVGEKIFPFQNNSISIITKNEIHLAQSQRGSQSEWSFVFLDINDILLSRFPEMTPFNISGYSGPDFQNIVSGADHPVLAEIIKRIIDELKYQRNYFQVSVISLVTQMAIYLERIKVKRNENESPQLSWTNIYRIRPVLEYIAQNYWQSISLDHLAELCFMSTRNFTRVFRDTIGRSAHDYIIDTRIAMVCNQLLRSNKQMWKIAMDNGFNSISSFNRAFKKKFGMSPREWQKRYI